MKLNNHTQNNQHKIEHQRSNNLDQYDQLKSKIIAIQQSKGKMLGSMSEFFNQFRKKILKAIQKSEKSMELAINTSFNLSLSKLYNICQMPNLNKLELKQYERKAEKVLNSYKIKSLEITQLFTSLYNKIKPILQSLKSDKILKTAYQFKQNNDLVAYSHQNKLQTVTKQIVPINGKIATISENYTEIVDHRVKHVLNKKVHAACEVTINKNKKPKQQQLAFKQKSKKLLLCLENQEILGLYSDKLVLSAYKLFKYKQQQLVGLCQIGTYIFIIERFRITRINLINLNEIYKQIFTKPIQSICQSAYCDMLTIYMDKMIQLLDIYTFEVINVISMQGVIKMMNVDDCLIIILKGGVRVYRGMHHYYSFAIQLEIVDMRKLTQDDIIFVTKSSQFIHLNIQNVEKKEHQYWKQLPIETYHKNTKQMVLTDTNIIILTDGGKKLCYYEI